mgnify:CR=1 FL=1
MARTVFIDGDVGTTGLQIRERLASHGGVRLLEIEPDRRKDVQRRRELINQADLVVLCLPDAASRESVALIDPANDRTRVVDASTAHRVADGWCLLGDAAQDWVLSLPAVQAVEGASPRALPEVAWPVVARLGLGSALRRLADQQARCVLHLRDGDRHDGVLTRVGRDFVELVTGADRSVLVAWSGLAAVQSRG